MSFGGLGGGLVGGALGSMMGGAMDAVLGANDIALMPIPAFYFEVIIYENEIKFASLDPPPIEEKKKGLGGMLKSAGAGALSAAKGMVKGPNTLNPGENDKEWWTKAFIEVSGIELGVETSSKNYGGDNFPLDLPTTMKNPHVNLKRLVRPQLLDKKDEWNSWIDKTLYSMAYWETPIQTKYIQINVMHPNLREGGAAYILKSINLEGAYPCKVSYSGLNSTSEDLLIQEIEVSYRNIHLEKTEEKDSNSIANPA